MSGGQDADVYEQHGNFIANDADGEDFEDTSYDVSSDSYDDDFDPFD